MPEQAGRASKGFVPSPPTVTGTYYALIIGISKYHYLNDLEFPIQDARRMGDLLHQAYIFQESHICYLENPTRDDIIETLDELDAILRPNDNLLIFYAGHGHWEAHRSRGYWLPADARPSRRSAWISNATLQDYLRGFNCRHALIISDSCFSGALLLNRSHISEASADIQTLYHTKSRQALTSGVKEEVPDRSIFFQYLSYVLKTNRKHFLTATELYAKIRNKVIEESSLHQNPQFGAILDTGDEGGDFIFIAKGKSPLTLSKETVAFQELLKDKRVRERLIALRQHLDKVIPSKENNKNLLVASWNIRKLGGYDYGGRLPESLGYIAEIISRFHIVAIQEIYGDLQVLDDLKSYLGKHWHYTFSDTSVGYGYRLGYFFDRRKVQQRGPTNDLILPHKRLQDARGRFVYEPVIQLLRPPFNCGFQVDDLRLLLCNVHLVFSGQAKKQRLQDLDNILNYWNQRLSQKNNWSRNIVLLGNFQSEKSTAREIHKIKEHNFIIPNQLQVASNISQTRYYNQIAFSDNTASSLQIQRAGVFPFFDTIFKKEDKQIYLPFYESFQAQATQLRTAQSKHIFYEKFWRIAQISDNLPLWVEIGAL